MNVSSDQGVSQLDPDEIRKFDLGGMVDRILGFPDQLEDANRIASDRQLGLSHNGISNICLTGMGGSGISGEVIACCLADKLSIPFLVNRHYSLPNFVQENSLVFVSSYSGNTEETLSSYEEAHRRGAKIICITSGGELAERARANKHPVFSIPSGYLPRAALGYLSVPLLYGLHYAGLISGPGPEISETTTLLRKLAEKYHPSAGNNAAKQISRTLQGKVPLVYAAAPNLAIVVRWRGQLAENSKVLAFSNVFPELNHNEIMGWGPLDSVNKHFQIIYLKDRADHAKIRKRMDVTKVILEEQTAPVVEVESQGESLLARMFSLIFLGDMVSIYLAALNQVDPSPIGHIDYLKSKLT